MACNPDMRNLYIIKTRLIRATLSNYLDIISRQRDPALVWGLDRSGPRDPPTSACVPPRSPQAPGRTARACGSATWRLSAPLTTPPPVIHLLLLHGV